MNLGPIHFKRAVRVREVPDSIETPMPARTAYLSGCDILQTTYPLLTAESAADLMQLFGVSDQDIQPETTKMARQPKHLELVARSSAEGHVIRMSLEAPDLSLHSTVKWSEELGQFQLDAFQIVRGGSCEAVPCCTNTIEKSELMKLIGYFGTTATALRTATQEEKILLQQKLRESINTFIPDMNISFAAFASAKLTAESKELRKAQHRKKRSQHAPAPA